MKWYDKNKKTSSADQCGKTLSQSMFLRLAEDHYLGHDCCEQDITCTLPKNHEGNHVDESHAIGICPLDPNTKLHGSGIMEWSDAPNPYSHVDWKESMKWFNQDNNLSKESMVSQEELWDKNDRMIMTAAQIEKKIQDIFNLQRDKKYWHYESARKNGVSHDQFMEAANRAGSHWSGGFGGSWSGMNLHDYTYGIQRGIKHKDLMDVDDKGYNLRGYVMARGGSWNDKKLNCTHNEAMDVLAKRMPITYYGTARRAGATHKEVLDAKKQKANIGRYADLRNYLNVPGDYKHQDIVDFAKNEVDPYLIQIITRNGATKDEILDASKNNFFGTGYLSLREQGSSHTDVKNVADKLQPYGVRLSTHAMVLSTGATEPEAFDLYGNDDDIHSYTRARSNNACTHQEALEATKLGQNNSAPYNKMRSANLNHIDAMQTIQKIGDSNYAIAYSNMLANGYDKSKLDDVIDNGANLNEYNRLTSFNKNSHEKAMKELVPNYNPYRSVDWTASKKWFEA